MRTGSTFNPDNVTSKLNAAVAQAADSTELLADIHKNAAKAASGVNLPVDTDPYAKRPGEEGGPTVPPIVTVPDIPDLRLITTLLASQQSEVMTAWAMFRPGLGQLRGG